MEHIGLILHIDILEYGSYWQPQKLQKLQKWLLKNTHEERNL